MPVAQFRAKPLESSRDRVERAVESRQGARFANGARGHCIGSTEDSSSGLVHATGSIVAQLGSGEDLAAGIREGNVRYSKIAGRGRRNLLFVVDTSGSMLSDGRLSMVKGCVVSLLEDAYQKRTRVAVVSYGGAKARLALPFTTSSELAAKRVEGLLGGGGTPLLGALAIASSLIEPLKGEPASIILLSDGRYERNRAIPTERRLREFGAYCRAHGIRICLIDAGGKGRTGRKRAMLLASMLHAEYKRLDDMRADSLAEAVAELA